MRVILALAALPAVVMWAAMPSASPPVKAKPVQTEGITARRMDENTFRLRWPIDLPPTTEVRAREHGWQDRAAQARVSASRGDDPILAPATHQTRTRRASLRTDICARHNMRRVMVGKFKWRCRR
jgi:hypothetical protein